MTQRARREENAVLDMTRAYGLTFLFPEGDKIIGASLRAYGEFARPEAELIAAHLAACESPGCFIDVGANIGAIALPVAAAQRRWRVMALEAHRGLANVLAANALNNQLYHVEVINAAAGAESSIVRFPDASLSKRINFGVLSVDLGDKTSTEGVRMVTLDELAPADTRFVKIDVEGYEIEVLRGAQGLIEARRTAWLLEANRGYPERVVETMRILRDAGHQLFWFFAPFVTGAPRKSGQAVATIAGDMNFVALPPGVPNLWDLQPIIDIEADWPNDLSAFGYLARFGFKAAPVNSSAA